MTNIKFASSNDSGKDVLDRKITGEVSVTPTTIRRLNEEIERFKQEKKSLDIQIARIEQKKTTIRTALKLTTSEMEG